MIAPQLFLLVFLAVYLAQTTLRQSLEKLNRRHSRQQGNAVPASFDGFIDPARLAQISAYSDSRSLLRSVRSLTSDGLLLTIILCGFLPALERMLTAWHVPFMLAGLLFFLVPGFIQAAVELPFDYYQTFIIEERFGFNRSSLRTWLSDRLKTGLLSLVLSAVLLSLIFWTVRRSPAFWWLWGFCLVSLVQIILVLLYPVLIGPLFNKFAPIEDESLAAKINRLMVENGINVKKILQMDAATRSKHTNAYFTGFGRTKQIVLYDTLLQTHPDDEILAVLAHEAGHFRKKHVLKQFLFFSAATLAGFYLTHRLLDWPALYLAFGFETANSYVGLFLIMILWQKTGFFLLPLYMALSRRHERQADAFAATILRDPTPLARALKRMAADNLSNLAPHPLYVSFHYSHPPLVERVTGLESNASKSDPSRLFQESKI